MQDFKLDETSGLPVWVQLRNRFVYLIKTGHYEPGEQLPSVRSLAADLSINYNTVSKAYVDLEHSGYVVSVRGRGVFVKEVARESCEDMDWSRFLGRKNKLLQATSRSRSHGAL